MLTKHQKRWGVFFMVLTFILIIAFYPLPDPVPIQYYDRESGELQEEKVAGENWLLWLYHNPVGEATLWALVKRKVVSSVYGDMMDDPSSVDKIEPFVEEYDVDLGIAKKQEFESFNDFFTRKLKEDARSINSNPLVAVSPADGKILAYKDISNSYFIIKGYLFDVESFLDHTDLAENYDDGSMIVVRLAPPDYHRFHFPVGGKVSASYDINGWYYSVNPIALRDMVEIFILNKREYTIISSPIFGNVIMAEVGATMVGSIVQTYNDSLISKGQEKGYFKFGGSTVVLLFEKDQIIIDEDLLNNTRNGYETMVKMGERIGIAADSTAAY